MAKKNQKRVEASAVAALPVIAHGVDGVDTELIPAVSKRRIPGVKGKGGMLQLKPHVLKIAAIGGIPVEVRPGIFQQRRADARNLTPLQRAGFRALYDGVAGRNKLEGGREITTTGDAIRWLLERIGKALDRAKPVV